MVTPLAYAFCSTVKYSIYKFNNIFLLVTAVIFLSRSLHEVCSHDDYFAIIGHKPTVWSNVSGIEGIALSSSSVIDYTVGV